MRRAFFFILAVLFANASFASIPRVSILDDAPAIDTPSAETRVWASDVLAPFERQAESELTRALRRGYDHAGTTNASGLVRFLSVDPAADSVDLRRPQSWNRYTYVENGPVNYVDPFGLKMTCVTNAKGDGERCDVVPDFGFQSFLAFSAALRSGFLGDGAPRQLRYSETMRAWDESWENTWTDLGQEIVPDVPEDEVGVVMAVLATRLPQPVRKPTIGAIRKALAKVHAELGGKLPKGKPGKFGSPQRGTSRKGYRLDPPHPNARPGSPEEKWHINYWDYTFGKKGRGGKHGAVAID